MPANKNGSTILVDIFISADEYLRHYQGQVTQVSAVARNGLRVRFPSKILTPFVTMGGIRGCFAIHFDANHKFVSIDKVE